MTTNSSINSDQSLKTTDSPTFGGMSINNSAGSGFAMTGNLPVLSTTNNGATNTQGVRTAFFKNRNGAAAQAGDAILRIQNNLLNSSLANVNVAEIGSFVLNANAGSEAGQFAWSTAVAGTLTSQLTLDTKLTSQVDIDFNSANHTLGASLGANTLTVGGTTSTILLQGTTNISAPLMIEGDLFTGTNSLSVLNTTVTNILSASTGISKNNGITLGDIGSGQGFGFTFTKTGTYSISYTVSYRPSTATGDAEIYLTENDGSGDTGDRFAYNQINWSTTNTFPSNLNCTATFRITDITKTYRIVTFQTTSATQTLGVTNANRQRSSYSIQRISDL